MMLNGKAVFVWTHETHRKSGQTVCSWLRALGYSVDEQQHNARPLPDLSGISEVDVIVAATGGRLLNHMINTMNGSRRPIFISVFPGILVDEQLEALLTRVNADIVCMNSRKDFDRFSRICSALQIGSRGLLTGPLWSMPSKISAPPLINPNRYHLFAEQDIIPNDQAVEKLSALLADLANRFPEDKFLIRGHPKTVEGGNKSRMALQNFPSNVSYHEGGFLDWNCIASVITISSSLAVTAVFNEVPTYIVTNFGSKNVHTSYFKGSGLLTRMEDINLSVPRELNREWCQQNIFFPGAAPAEFRKNLVKKTRNHELGIRNIMLRLALRVPSEIMRSGVKFRSKIIQSHDILNTSLP